MQKGETPVILAKPLRYLVVLDGDQVEAATALCGHVYAVMSLDQAKNGHLAEISGNPIVLWPDRETVGTARAWGKELAEFGEVKLLDASKSFLPTPAEMIEIGHEYSDFIEHVTGAADNTVNIIEVLAPANAALNVDPPAAPNGRVIPLSSPEAQAGSTPHDESIPVEAYQDASDAPEIDYHPGLAGRAYVSTSEASGAAEWPEPLDISRALFAGKPLPIDLIPAALQQITADCAKRTGIDAAPYFFGFLGAISGLASDCIRVQPKQHDETWTVRPCLWPVAIGGPSSGKSPGLEEGMRWVQRKDTAAVLDNIRKKKDYDFLMSQYADDCAAARKAKGPRPPEPEPPVLREYWVQRGTTEGVTRVLEHSEKVVWYMDEFSGIVSGWDAYKSGKSSGDREFVLQLWNGGPGKNTLAGKTVVMRNASAVLCGGSTPVAMLKCAGGKLQNDGFLQRTLLCMVPDMIEGTDEPADMQAIAAYDALLDTIVDMPGGCTLRLSPDAGRIYSEFCAGVLARIKSEDNEALAAHLGKWAGLAPRIMLIYQIIESASHGQYVKHGDQISGQIAAQVCQLLMQWELSHLEHFWREIMADKVGRRFSQTIARFMLAHPELERLNFRDHISRPHWREFDSLKPWEIKEAVNSLVSAAWIQPEGLKNNTYGVPSSYLVNPRLAGAFQDQRAQEIVARAAKREELEEKRGRGREPGED